MPEKLYTLVEAAEYFRVSRRTFQNHIKRHPFYRSIGRKKLFSDSDLARLYDSLPTPQNRDPLRVKIKPHLIRNREQDTLRELRELLSRDRKKRTGRKSSNATP